MHDRRASIRLKARKAQGAPSAITKGIIMAQDNSKAQAPEATFGIEALVEATGAPAKDVRRWLRAQATKAEARDTLPGKGGRYAFTQAHITRLAAAYTTSKARKGSTSAAEALMASLPE